MEYTVTILPSGHRFTAHENESILEAGLRAGHNLKYQCDNGSCGGCRARLVSGEIHRIQNGDFSFNELDKQLGYFLPCAYEARSDLEIEAGELTDVSDVPFQEISARVRKIEILRDTIVQLQVRTPRTRTLRFLAGQSVKLRLPNGSTRKLQIASCPCNGMVLEFHVRCVDGEDFSEYLFHQMVLNEEVLIEGPFGDFVLDENSDRPMLFIAYDTGFAGIKSLIEHAIALDMTQEMHLYRIACHPETDYMHNVCRAWDDAIDNLHYHAVEHCIPMDCGDVAMAASCEQFLSVLEQGDTCLIGSSDVYLCGIEEMISNLGKIMVERGLAEERLKVQKVD